jgi:hypothetical protein
MVAVLPTKCTDGGWAAIEPYLLLVVGKHSMVGGRQNTLQRHPADSFVVVDGSTAVSMEHQNVSTSSKHFR